MTVIRIQIMLLLSLVLCLRLPLEAQPVPIRAFPTADALSTVDLPAADLAELTVRWQGASAQQAANPTLYQVGDKKRFYANNTAGQGLFVVEAKLEAAGDHVAIWRDLRAELDVRELQALAWLFDSLIYDPVRALWGEEANPGVDGDPRLHIVFAHGLGAGLGAYYARRHSYPAAIVPNSNAHEMFFVNLDSYGPPLTSDPILSALAHEFQHMIRAHVDGNADSWLNEGYSVFTEIYLDYPGSIWQIQSFLNTPGTQLNSFGISGAISSDYGAAALLVAYFFERFGEDGLHLLSQNTRPSITAFNQTLDKLDGPDFDTFFADWVAANWIQDTSSGYGYALIDLPQRPQIRAQVDTLPMSIRQQTAQYAADYYLLQPSRTGQTLSISLTLPEATSLLPVDPASGSWAWYSNRGDFSHSTLSQSFDLRGVDQATLDYSMWYSIEGGWDYVYLTASADQGKTWTLLQTPEMDSSNPNGTAFGPGYTGQSDGWIEQSVSLDDFVGHEVTIQFEMVTDDAVNYSGLALDDISLPQIGYASDFEADRGGWQANGWIYSDNRLPQRAWVQVIQMTGGEDSHITRWMAEGGESSWQLVVDPAADEVVIIVSPIAPLTTIPVDYTLEIMAG